VKHSAIAAASQARFQGGQRGTKAFAFMFFLRVLADTWLNEDAHQSAGRRNMYV